MLGQQGDNLQNGYRRRAIETVDLRRVWLQRDEPVNPGGQRQIRHQFGRGWLARRQRRLVLPRIGQVGEDARNPAGPKFSKGANRQQKGDIVLVNTAVGQGIDEGLEQKRVTPSHLNPKPHARFRI